MILERLQPNELPDLVAFLKELDVEIAPANLQQFAAPRTVSDDLEVITLVAREEGRILGTMGWLRTPVNLGGRRTQAVWPINFWVRPDLRGRGMGKLLLSSMNEDGALRITLNGTESSLRVSDKLGARVLGNLTNCRWFAPNPSPRLALDRVRQGARSRPPEKVRFRIAEETVIAERVERPGAAAPDQRETCDNTVPRTAAYLEFAFGGSLSGFFVTYRVMIEEKWAGLFVLTPAADRKPLLGVEIIDLDALPGREAAVMEAARRTAFLRGDIVRLRISGRRFTSTLSASSWRFETETGIPLRVWCDDDVAATVGTADDWRLTYADQDQYRWRRHMEKWVS